MKAILLLSLIVSLTACGFNLRGSYAVPLSMKQMCLQDSNAPQLGRELAQRLERSKVVLQTDSSACVVLKIHSAELERSVLSLFPNAQVAEYQLNYSVEYSLAFAGEEARQYTALVVRDYQDDPDAVMAKSKEMDMLEAELRRYAAEQILLRLASLERH